VIRLRSGRRPWCRTSPFAAPAGWGRRDVPRHSLDFGSGAAAPCGAWATASQGRRVSCRRSGGLRRPARAVRVARLSVRVSRAGAEASDPKSGVAAAAGASLPATALRRQ
jgi:hypothetical protein